MAKHSDITIIIPRIDEKPRYDTPVPEWVLESVVKHGAPRVVIATNDRSVNDRYAGTVDTLRVKIDEGLEAGSFLPRGWMSVIDAVGTGGHVIVLDDSAMHSRPDLESMLAEAAGCGTYALSVSPVRDHPAQCELYYSVRVANYYGLPETTLPAPLAAHDGTGADRLWISRPAPFDWHLYSVRPEPGALYSLQFLSGETDPVLLKTDTVATEKASEITLYCPDGTTCQRVLRSSPDQMDAFRPILPGDEGLHLERTRDGRVLARLDASVAGREPMLHVRAPGADGIREMGHIPLRREPGTDGCLLASWRMAEEDIGYAVVVYQAESCDYADITEPILSNRSLWLWDEAQKANVDPDAGTRFAGRQDLPDIFMVDGTLVSVPSGGSAGLKKAYADGAVKALKTRSDEESARHETPYESDNDGCEAGPGSRGNGILGLANTLKAVESASAARDSVSLLQGLSNFDREYAAIVTRLGRELDSVRFSHMQAGFSDDIVSRAALALRIEKSGAMQRVAEMRRATDRTRFRALTTSAARLIEHDRPSEALPLLESVLCCDHEKIRDEARKVLSRIGPSPALSENVEAIIGKTDFVPSLRLSHPNVGTSVGVATDDSGVISVSDYSNGCIHQFSHDGEYRSLLIDGLSRPRSVVANGECLWVCEFDTSRLHVYDRQGKRIDTISLTRLDKRFSHPVSLAISGRTAAIVTMDAQYGGQALHTFDPEAPGTFRTFDIAKMERLIDVALLGDRLFCLDFVTGRVWQCLPGENRVSLFSRTPLPRPARGLCASSTGLYVTSPRFISKISTEGDTIFTKDLARRSGPEPGISCCHFQSGKENHLYATDLKTHTIQTFKVGP